MRIPGIATACVAGLVCTVLAASPALAQRVRLAPDTEVRSVEFDFVGAHQMKAEDFAGTIGTKAPGGTQRMKEKLAWLPFVDSPEPRTFDPLELQMDLERLRRYYRRKGFLDTAVEYLVSLSKDRRHAHVTFIVTEGPPLLIRSVTLRDSLGDAHFELPEGFADVLPQFQRKLEKAALGKRLDDVKLEELQGRVIAGLADHGYPFVVVEPRARIDSLAHAVDLALCMAFGHRVRIGAIDVEGLHSVETSHVVRQFQIAPNDWYSRRELDRGRDNLVSVPLFSRSTVAFEDSSHSDSIASIRVAVSETRPRITNLELGYVTDGAGVTGQVRWTHPNFTGGARSLDALGLFQTGWGATNDQMDRLIRISIPLTQPHVGSPNMSLSVGPAYEYHDNPVDRSRSWSGLATLVYRFNPLQSAALRYEFIYRQLEELRVLEVSSEQSTNVTLLAFGSSAFLDSLKQPETIHELTFFTSVGRLDNISRPRHGMIVKPNLSVTLPFLNGDVDFSRADVQFSSFFPVPGRANAFAFRGKLGGLWPTGASVPHSGESGAVSWLRLRDQLFMAGGSSDVRGYANRMLGPKVPSVEASIVNGDTVLTSDSYVPVGGLRRFTASAELRIGLPKVPPNLALHLFADCGRVWTTDEAFRLSSNVANAGHTFYTTGGGLGYYTPVGAIRVDVGYKLNPSILDLRDPQDVLNAIEAGRPVSTAPVIWQRRYAILLSLGLNF